MEISFHPPSETLLATRARGLAALQVADACLDLARDLCAIALL